VSAPVVVRNPLDRRKNEIATFASDGSEGVVVAALKYDYEQIDKAYRSQVSEAAREINASGKRMKESTIRIGQKLTAVKALLPHGQFEDWCFVEFEMSSRMAQLRMSVGKAFEGKSEIISLLSDTAMYMLSGDSVPESARDEVISIAQATGGRPKVKEIKAIIEAHKSPTARPVSTMPAETEAYYEDDEIVLPVATARYSQPDPFVAAKLSRNERLNAAIADCRAFRMRLDEIEQMTGQYRHAKDVRNGIDALIGALTDNLV
jgi:hypothetical protein